MQERRNAGHLPGKLAHAGDSVSKNSDGTVPAAHNLGGLQAIVKYIERLSMIKAAAHLPSDIEEVPDGKAFFASEHGSDAVALYVFHRGIKLPVDFSGAVNGSKVGVAQSLGSFCLFEQARPQFGGAFAKGGQLDDFQSDSLAGLGIVGLVDCARGGL